MPLPENDALFIEEFPCAYFDDGRIARIEYLITDTDAMRSFHQHLATGHRRLGRTFYRTICRGCSACVPIRINVGLFQARKSQKRTLRMNADIQVIVRPSGELSPEQRELFSNYLLTKHNKKEEANNDEDLQLRIIHFGYARSIEMDYYLDGRLIGVGIVDAAQDALSANYFYYDTGFLRRRLGVFSILQEIALAQALGKRYYYLGFLIEENPKMAYKRDFRPHELYLSGAWKTV
ncbi:MAG: arginine-tRNA-protein transferase [Nitrospirae bacterium]|nr:MAG: arginine-tRNA-protein transferase [Nitrospirota bacterium]